MGYSSGEYPLLQEKQQECELCVASAFSSINMKSGMTDPGTASHMVQGPQL